MGIGHSWAQGNTLQSPGSAPPASGGIVLPESCRTQANATPHLRSLLSDAAAKPTAEGYNSLGLEFANQHQFSCAIPSFQAALRLDPLSLEPRYNLGVAYASAGNQKQAESELRTVIQQKPDDALAHNALGLVLDSLGQ